MSRPDYRSWHRGVLGAEYASGPDTGSLQARDRNRTVKIGRPSFRSFQRLRPRVTADFRFWNERIGALQVQDSHSAALGIARVGSARDQHFTVNADGGRLQPSNGVDWPHGAVDAPALHCDAHAH